MEKLNLRDALEKNGAKLDETQIAFVNGLSEAIRQALDSNTATISQTIEQKMTEVKATLPEDVAEEIRSLGEKMKKIEERSPVTKLNESQKRSLKTKVKEHHQDIVDAIRGRKNFDLGVLVIDAVRAAAPHYNDNGTVSLGSGVYLPTVENFKESDIIATIRYPKNFIFDVVSNSQVAKVPKVLNKKEQTAKEGDVAIVEEHDTKPLVQYKWVINAINRNKIAGRVEWSEEFEIDNERLFQMIVQMIENDVIREWNDVTLAAIISNSTAYTSPTVYTGQVNGANADDVAVVLTTLINSNNYNADTLVMNPIDVSKLLLLKDTIGQKLETLLLSSGNTLGLKLIASNKVAVGNMLVFDSTTYREQHTGVSLRVGQYANQLITNEWTLIAEMYTLLETAALDRPATRYGAIATIAADIETP